METLIQERVTQKENELNATYDERLLNYEERCVEIVAIPDAQLTPSSLPSERDLQRQLRLTKDQLRELRASNETNQAKLFDQSERQGGAAVNIEFSKFPPNYGLHWDSSGSRRSTCRDGYDGC